MHKFETINKQEKKTSALSTARRTVWSLLETLSNNDFVAIMNFSDTTQEVVPCFKDRLVQATPENLKKYNELMLDMKPEGIANLTEAFIKAFTLLKNYRETRGCGPQTPCNQLIMLVTDGIASNITEVYEQTPKDFLTLKGKLLK